MTSVSGPMHPRRERQRRFASSDQRGDYSIFIAVIASALLLFGGIAYDAPRLIAARQHAVHNAGEAARVAAATVASGGTVAQARSAAEQRIAAAPRLYGSPTRIASLQCVGTRVEITLFTSYRNSSAIAVFREVVPIIATGAAEAVIVGPSGDPNPLGYLPECPFSS